MQSLCAASFHRRGSSLGHWPRKTFSIVVLNLLFGMQSPISFLVEVQIRINDNRPFSINVNRHLGIYMNHKPKTMIWMEEF